MRHCDDVVAGIDEVDFAGDAGGEIREQIKPRAAEVFQRHAAVQRRMALLEGEHGAGVADPRTRKGADRSRRNRIDADGARAEVDGEIAHGSFQRRLGKPHGVIVRHGAQAAVIGQRQHGAAVRH